MKFDGVSGRQTAVEVLIVGAGPAGAVAAALLRRQGRGALVLEREQFPRFSIGESLLPQSMEYLGEAGMLPAVGYRANVKLLWGHGFALLGNAGDFLDRIFSSGVTRAFESASLAAAALDRQFGGETVDWQAEFAAPLKRGVDTFRAFVESWYRGGFQQIIFHADPPPLVGRMISAVLAGYAWDTTNPYVREAARPLAALEQLCCGR